MKNDQFNRIVKESADKLVDRLLHKGTEYALTVDRLRQFYNAAEILEFSAEQVAWTYAMKHITKMAEYIMQDALTQDIIEESGYDIMAYIVLIQAIFADRVPVMDEDLEVM